MKSGGYLNRYTPLTSKGGGMKRTPINRGKKGVARRIKAHRGIKRPSPRQQKDKLWKLCREITNLTHPPHCYTCSAQNLEGANKQLGHFIPSSVCGAFLRYDLRNLRWQCMRCNQFAGGNGAEYYRRMVLEVGQEAVDQIFRDQQKVIKADSTFYEAKIQEYESTLRSLQ